MREFGVEREDREGLEEGLNAEDAEVTQRTQSVDHPSGCPASLRRRRMKLERGI